MDFGKCTYVSTLISVRVDATCVHCVVQLLCFCVSAVVLMNVSLEF